MWHHDVASRCGITTLMSCSSTASRISIMIIIVILISIMIIIILILLSLSVFSELDYLLHNTPCHVRTV